MPAGKPRVAVPGGAATAPVRRAAASWTGMSRPVTPTSKRHHQPGPHRVFVRHVPEIGPEERMLADEIAWCEAHCAGHWSVCYGQARSSAGRLVFLAFTESADARSFESWLRVGRQHRAAPQDAAT